MQAKKLNLALHLNPASSEADAAALDVLQQWYAETKESHGGDSSAMEAAVRQFHHDVYLAGLHLHLVSTRFCRQVADSLTGEKATAESLVQHMKTNGLWALPQDSEEKEAVFSDAQLEQIGQLFARMPTPAAPSDAGAEAALAEHGGRLDAILDELKHLRALSEQQAAELHRLESDRKRAPAPEQSGSQTAEEINVADMAPQLAQMQKIRDKGVF